VLPGIPDGFPETAHSVDHTQRSRVEETDLILAADELSRAHPPTPTAPPLGRRPPALPLHYSIASHAAQARSSLETLIETPPTSMTLVFRFYYIMMSSVRSTSDGRGPVTRKEFRTGRSQGNLCLCDNGFSISVSVPRRQT
jgi:hypothetical protein